MKKISRRSFLAAAGMTAAACMLSACGGSSSSSAAGSSAASSTAGQAITTLEDLAGKTVGVQLGTTGDIYISDEVGNAEGLNLAECKQYNQGGDAVQALLAGQIDAVVIDDQVAVKFVEANPDNLTILDTEYAVEDYAAAIAKDNTELTAQFNTAIAALKANGTLEAILDKYINKTEGAAGYVTPEGTEYPNGKLVMGTNATFEPYEYIEGGEITGIDAEFAKAICDMLGYELEIQDMEFDSLIVAVQGHKVDFAMAGMTVTEERLQYIDFTDSYCTGVQVVIVAK